MMSYLSLFSKVPCTKIGPYIVQSVNSLTRMTSKIWSLNCLYFSSLPPVEVINYPNDLSRKWNHYQKLRVSIVSSKRYFFWGGMWEAELLWVYFEEVAFWSAQKCFYNWSCSFHKLENCKWCAKAVDRALVTEMRVEPGADSDWDTEGEDGHGVAHTLPPEQRDSGVQHSRWQSTRHLPGLKHIQRRVPAPPI